MKINDYTYEEKQTALDEAHVIMNPVEETNAEQLGRIKADVCIDIHAVHYGQRESADDLAPGDTNWLIDQAEQAQELENRIQNKILPEIEKGYEQNMRYREALEFYANKENHELDEYDTSAVDKDFGNKARQALEVERRD